MSETALQWKHVSFSIRHGFWMKKKKILDDIDISIPAGSVLGLVGPNGAGKTTTIKLGAGLLQPETGSVLIKNQPSFDRESRSCIGFLTETQYIYPYLYLKEWLLMMGQLAGMKGNALSRRVKEVVGLLALEDQTGKKMGVLSKGQLQRAGLAQALIHEPEILILDEPMSGLDPLWRFRVQKILANYKLQGGTIIFSSHILFDVERLSDTVVLIQSGKVIWHGKLSDLPREIVGYEAVVGTSYPEYLEEFSNLSSKTHLPEGTWRINFSPDQKKDLLKLAHSGKVTLESLRPIQAEIEEVLFGVGNE